MAQKIMRLEVTRSEFSLLLLAINCGFEYLHTSSLKENKRDAKKLDRLQAKLVEQAKKELGDL